MIKHLLLGSLVLAATTLSVQAAQFSVSPKVEYFNVDDDYGFESSPLYGLGVGMKLSDRTAIEVSAMQGHSDQDGGGKDVRARRYSLDATYDLTTGKRITPYIVGGFGEADIDLKDAKDVNEGFVTMGAGVKYSLSEHIRARAELLGHYNYDSTHEADYSAVTAIDFLFGGNKPAPVAQAAPAPIADHVSMQLAVLFDSDKSAIKPQYQGEVKKAADFLNAHPAAKAVIEGHTDSTASDAYNQKLSERRAHAVMDALVHTYGIDANRLAAAGYGESKPIADNATLAGRAQNRRVMAEFEGVSIRAQ
jgi:OOP family OmpA-OmpF porin